LSLLVLTDFTGFLEFDCVLISLIIRIMTEFNLTTQFLTVRFQTKKELVLFISYDLTTRVYSSIRLPCVSKVFPGFPFVNSAPF